MNWVWGILVTLIYGGSALAQEASNSAGLPARYGRTEGEFFIGHRAVHAKYTGWGWIRSPREPWARARWAMLMEQPGNMVAPHRFLSQPGDDHAFEYRLYGRFAEVKGYEPYFDILVDVFILEGFEVLGKAKPIDRAPPLPPDLQKPRGSSRSTARPTGAQMLRDRRQ
ncbi:MAG: hypothetical protein OHK005_03130 [Candidatus Methylacidiphilales bacterium]